MKTQKSEYSIPPAPAKLQYSFVSSVVLKYQNLKQNVKMKVNIKLSPQQLNALVFHFPKPPFTPEKNREIRVARSVLEKVSLKMQKKQLETKHEATLFSKPKKVSFSLEYFEAHYLEKFIEVAETFPMNDYDRNVLRLIKSSLNQQMA